MATITYVHPLLLLLVSLFFLPAYCGVPFKQCEDWEFGQVHIGSTRLQASPRTNNDVDTTPQALLQYATDFKSPSVTQTSRSSPVITVTNVDMIQKTLLTGFNISATTAKSLTEANVWVTISYALSPFYERTFQLCELTACHVAPGPFVLSFDKICDFSIGMNVTTHIKIRNDGGTLMCIIFDSVPPPLSLKLMDENMLSSL